MHAVLDDDQVHAAVPVHVAASGGPEQNDLLRPGHLYDAPGDVVQDCRVQRRVGFPSWAVFHESLSSGV